MRQPEAIYINLDGRRFMDETGGLNDGKYLLRKQPGAISYCILDENLLTLLGQRLADNPPDVFDGWILKDFRALRPNGSVIKGLWAGGDCARTDMEKGQGPVGLNGGLGGAFAGGYKIALNILSEQ